MDGVRGFELHSNHPFEATTSATESRVSDCVIKHPAGWFLGGVNGSGVRSILQTPTVGNQGVASWNPPGFYQSATPSPIPFDVVFLARFRVQHKPRFRHVRHGGDTNHALLVDAIYFVRNFR